jgi:hypothetical protein
LYKVTEIAGYVGVPSSPVPGVPWVVVVTFFVTTYHQTKSLFKNSADYGSFPNCIIVLVKWQSFPIYRNRNSKIRQ